MIVAVSGSSGFVGKNLVSLLLDLGHEVFELDISKGIDILNWDQLRKVNKFDVFVHLAAKSFVPHSYDQPRDFYNVNINGVINGLELCRLYNAKFVFTSSYVYGNPQYLPITENHPLDGFNPYAETKIIGENICANYYKYFKVRSIILRPFNIYGHNQNENFLIPSILKQAKTGRIDLLDSRPKRDYIHIKDVVDAFKLAIENTTVEFDQFNIGFGKCYSVGEIVNIVNNIYKNKLDINYSDSKRKNEVLNTVADIRKIHSILKWSPKIKIETGLKQMINIL